MAMVTVGSWGNIEPQKHKVVPLGRDTDHNQLTGSLPGLAFGMGRSYGDVCLNPGGTLWSTSALNRFIGFEPDTGVLECEAGVTLEDIQRTMVPRGWILPVTPGTQVVTVGGAIANDIHGKNHHVRGTFGNHILQITFLRTDGSTVTCGPELLPDWFAATVGGLGLTGVITRAKIQLRAIAGPWMDTETLPYNSLSEFFHLADSSELDWEHTVSWVDCSSEQGRGIFMRANPTDLSRDRASKGRQLTMPFTPPISLVNKFTLSPFNAAYYHLNKWSCGKKTVHYEPFSYPLDNLRHWNRMYGPRGFYQYQMVVPRDAGYDAVTSTLQTIRQSGEGSFLAVLKTFGDIEAAGMLSFPMQGVTLALDFPNRGTTTLKLFERLDKIVGAARGRIYPAKDSRMSRTLFEQGYSRIGEFMNFRDPGISSAMSRRLLDY